jgi:hypothetical protein
MVTLGSSCSFAQRRTAALGEIVAPGEELIAPAIAGAGLLRNYLRR